MKHIVAFFKYSRHSITFKMLAFTTTAGLLLALVSIAISFYIHYQDESQRMQLTYSEISVGHVGDLKEILQNPKDQALLNSELNSILQEPYIDYVEVRTRDGNILSAGTRPINPFNTKQMDLIDEEVSPVKYLGQIVLMTEENEMMSRVWTGIGQNALFLLGVILLTNIIFFIGFEILINRHLRDLVAHTENINLNQLDQSFVLQRKEPKNDDELAILVKTYNKLFSNLGIALDNLKKANQNLAIEVEERKQAEQALAQEQSLLAKRVEERTSDLSYANAELARAARMKDEFMASMSHELRTPLAGILGLTEALNAHIYGEVNERQRRAISQVSESGEILLKTINDILDLSRIQAGQLELELNPFSIEAVCQSSLRMVKQMAIKKRISSSISVNPSAAILVSDERRLKQVLVNLLNNAVKFTPEGGQIGIEVQGNPEHHHIAISIWDTGIGISEEDQKKLFQPFIQLDSSLSRRYAGMGLGLSLVINLVELLGGGLQLESKLTQGSRFTISLPWNDETQNDLPAASPGFPEQIHKTGHPDALLSLEGKIMLVDDNELTLMTLKDYLSSLGARVTLCRSGVEALEAIKETPPDILLVDIQLPDLDGLEIIRRLRSEVKTIRLPIIALTALAMAGDRERCLAAGANEYIAKPFSLQHLAAILRDHLYEAPTTDTNQPPDPYFG